ncbi:hypothetical protein B0T26DRAFT_635387 [Lasiosphaeria miniovina]|uniref:Ubiquitin carboxyl-terminal hydrolase n=1 Tax=Lasiosphaeria miniovina TaxID=1954250 RepID=A0AA40BG60_9PEZI|nr:uncharacterized protein B0T26DRAFT_635387 [Lasiosphaeria miniovina]KAK0733328.1 hypothetical protein B0T26DRAFT_635387 [Lasiosphaeria miniovina]
MPDRSLTVATYAAGASLAAITLIYVFGPTYFLDSDPSSTSYGVFSSRKNGIIGLSNTANDCFINSVLQALAGLGDLRLYLIRETHRRGLDDGWVHTQTVSTSAWPRSVGQKKAAVESMKNMPDWKAEGLQKGLVTKALKDILDALNERPIYRKTISAGPFVKTLEQAFRQRISRQQQDAQEFLQVVAERLCDEYHAGRRARRFARQKATYSSPGRPTHPPPLDSGLVKERLAGLGFASADDPSHRDRASSSEDADPAALTKAVVSTQEEDEGEKEDGFPLEGKFESQIECLTCGFKPRPNESTFCSLTLNVPQSSATTLNACFDGMFKTEYIDDFKCEKCRLLHAISVLKEEAQKSHTETLRKKTWMSITRLQLAIDTDPEHPPPDITLPDLRFAPKRRIARHIRLTEFPKVLAIHLSRSIFDASSLSHKNSAKVSFPELLPLGGLLQQRKYKLLGLVTHKGSHHSGHYESFRRQNTYPPFSNPNTFQVSGVYSKAASPTLTPHSKLIQQESEGSSPLTSTPDLLSPRPETDLDANGAQLVSLPTRSPISKIAPKPSLRAGGQASTRVDSPEAPLPPASKQRQRKPPGRWWRISDEKVRVASTRDVLSMQREVYLLFYELEK